MYSGFVVTGIVDLISLKIPLPRGTTHVGNNLMGVFIFMMLDFHLKDYPSVDLLPSLCLSWAYPDLILASCPAGLPITLIPE